jgi:hypothetical protein
MEVKQEYSEEDRKRAEKTYKEYMEEHSGNT